MDLITCPRPPVDSPRHPETIAHGDRTVEGGPAHDLRIEKVLRVATHLPDPMILLNPTLSRGVGATREEPFGAVVDVAQLFNEPEGGAPQLSVHVNLVLVPRPVPHPHGSTVSPSPQVGQGTLGQIALTADAEHDLQRLVAAQC